jgi:phosphate/phosphite/phosphonate ABC transporter binding protein
MKKLFLILSLLIMASMVLAACAPAATPTDAPPPPEVEETEPPEPVETEEEMMLPDLGGREITIAVENAYLPYNFVSLETGEPGGWDYDFIDEACARLNCKPVWIEFGWDTMIAAVGDDQFDMATDGITITEDRAKQVDFSDGYASIDQRLLVRTDEDRFESIEELAADPELILAQQIGTTNEAVALKYVPEDRIIGFGEYGLAIQAVISGDSDGAVIDETAGLGYLGANPDDLKFVGPSLSSDALGFIFPLGSDLVEPFNQVIAAFKADGTLDLINIKWFGKTEEEIIASAGGITDGVYAEEEAPETDLGTEDHPIQVLFVPSVNIDFMIESGDAIEEFLNEATGLVYEVSVPTSYTATVEEMCASPTDTIGFIPAMLYALGNQLCGIEPALASSRYGWNVYWGQYLVARDSDIQTIEDLEGKTWGFGESASTSGFLVPAAQLADLGITVGDQVETGGHPESARAVYNGEVDFATTYFSPPLLPEGTWALGDPPDVPDELVEECAVTEDDKLMCGGYRILDARSALREEAPDIIQKVRILDITPEIPNDTMSWSPEFPDELREPIVQAILDYLASDACQVDEELICSEDFYNWTAAETIFDENFDGTRLLMEQQGITLENVGE